jgi:hypothetical protein
MAQAYDAVDADTDDESPSEEQLEAAQLERATSLLSQVQEREKEFEQGWWKKADEAMKVYCIDSADRKHADESPYNILYSNTEVLLPSLYSATPKPDTRGRFGPDAKLSPLVQLIDRFLTVTVDASSPGLESFDSSMSDATLSSLVPGMGYVRIHNTPSASIPITFVSGHFKTLVWGKASRWSKTPWASFKHSMPRAKVEADFSLTEGKDEVELDGWLPPEGGERASDSDNVEVYEIWVRSERKVYFVCDSWRKKLLKVSEDPLGLVGFYPTPGPLLLTAKPGRLSPVPLYQYYLNQAEELNRVTTRLNKVLSALRVRGAYNTLLGADLEKILASDELENGLVPAQESGMLAQGGGFDKHIWLLPIEKLVTVAQQLYQAREQIKQVVYELTGISDIIRGSSAASETATAQNLKDKWGSVRLRKMQGIVANYSRDLFRMVVDCASEHVPPQVWKQLTQAPLPLEAEKQAALQRKQQLMQMQAMVPQMPGQPQQPPPELQQLEQTISAPSIEFLLAQIKSDANRAFIINIQSSSTIDLDTATDKGDIAAFMNAMGQLLGGIQPLLALGPKGQQAAMAMLAGVCERYKFSLPIATLLRQVEGPPQGMGPDGKPLETGPSPEEKQAMAAEAQFKMEKIAADKELLQMKLQLERAKLQFEMEKLKIEQQKAAMQALMPPAPPAAAQRGKQNAPVRNPV